MSRPLTANRLIRRRADLRAVQRVAGRIEAFNAALDEELAKVTRPEERLIRLRDATNQITRAANDAIQAYRRVAGSIREELAAEHGKKEEAELMQRDLQRAREEMLRVLKVSSRRYPWASPWLPGDAGDPVEAVEAAEAEEPAPRGSSGQ